MSIQQIPIRYRTFSIASAEPLAPKHVEF